MYIQDKLGVTRAIKDHNQYKTLRDIDYKHSPSGQH